MKFIYCIRLWYKKLISRYFCIVEFCKICGVKQPLVWTADDKLYTEIAEHINVLCPKCFDNRANAKKIFIRWIPTDERISKNSSLV